MSLYDNDGDRARPSATEFGHVALIMAETILHLLVEKGLLNTEDAVSALQTTADVKIDLAAATDGEPSEQTRAAIDTLFQMMDSFSADLDADARGRARLSWEQRTRRD